MLKFKTTYSGFIDAKPIHYSIHHQYTEECFKIGKVILTKGEALALAEHIRSWACLK